MASTLLSGGYLVFFNHFDAEGEFALTYGVELIDGG